METISKTNPHRVQIDVKESSAGANKDAVICNLYTRERCVKIYMHQNDYEDLVRDGFFIRTGKERDSANVLNTTDIYAPLDES